MIVADRFVFLHLHKSGGSFVNEALLRFVPNARAIGYHLPRILIPPPYDTLPILGFVRNPWSYYVSWYHFQASRPRPNALYRIVSEGGRLGFKDTVRNLLELGSGSARLDAVLAALPGSYGGSGLNLPAFALAPIRGCGLGFYSYLYRYMYGERGPNVRIERSDDLRARLLDFLEGVGQRVTPALRDFVLDAPARNTSSHEAYATYYDEELTQLVASRDSLVIEGHRYRFGD